MDGFHCSNFWRKQLIGIKSNLKVWLEATFDPDSIMVWKCCGLFQKESIHCESSTPGVCVRKVEPSDHAIHLHYSRFCQPIAVHAQELQVKDRWFLDLTYFGPVHV